MSPKPSIQSLTINPTCWTGKHPSTKANLGTLPIREIELDKEAAIARIRLTKVHGYEGLDVKEIELNRID